MKNPALIYTDFMKCDAENRLPLVCLGTFRDLAEHEINLEVGMKLVFYNEDEDDRGNRDDLVVSGIVEYDEENENWVARIDWDEIQNISKLSPEKKKAFGFED